MKRFLNPGMKSLDEIMEGTDPFGEICSRILSVENSNVTPEERHFANVATFVGDVLNGGIGQALWNSSGDYFAEVEEFVDTHLGWDSSEAFVNLRNSFPGKLIPKQRELREGVLDEVADDVSEALEVFDSRFLKMERKIQSALVDYAKSHRESFSNLSKVGRRNV